MCDRACCCSSIVEIDKGARSAWKGKGGIATLDNFSISSLPLNQIHTTVKRASTYRCRIGEHMYMHTSNRMLVLSLSVHFRKRRPSILFRSCLFFDSLPTSLRRTEMNRDKIAKLNTTRQAVYARLCPAHRNTHIRVYVHQ